MWVDWYIPFPDEMIDDQQQKNADQGIVYCIKWIDFVNGVLSLRR